MKKEELLKLVNRQIKIEIFGGKKIEGKFVEIEKDEANLEWVIINDAIIDGKPYDITKMSITDIVCIFDTNRTLTPDSDMDKTTFVEQRSSATSGYESRPLSRTLRSTTTTPNGTPKDSAMVNSKSTDRSVASSLNLRRAPAPRAAPTLPSSKPAAHRSQLRTYWLPRVNLKSPNSTRNKRKWSNPVQGQKPQHRLQDPRLPQQQTRWRQHWHPHQTRS